MGVSSPKLSLLTTDKGIKLMLALESHNAFPISESPNGARNGEAAWILYFHW